MKITSNYLLIISLLLSGIQLSKGQTFDLSAVPVDTVITGDYEKLSRGEGLTRIELIETPFLPDITDRLTLDSVVSDRPAGAALRSAGSANLHPHIPNQHAINTTTTWAVGDIPIRHQVLPNGATTYTVPIESAPGRAGFQPSITLSYNSLGGNSEVGFGWGIGGLSSIVRTTSNVHYNGVTKPVEMTTSAQFVLDGMRLIQTISTSTVRTFAPEQGNLKVEAFMNAAITKYFKVWYPDGSTAIYGYENNNSNKLSYPVTQMTDKIGNKITFSYTELNNRYYIAEIKYGSSKTITNDFAAIKFFYKTRSDASSVYEAGLEIRENRLLDYIQCLNNGTVTRTYNLTHTLNRVSLLTQINCSLSSGSLNPLKFYYGTSNPQTYFDDDLTFLKSYFSNAPIPKLVVSKGKFGKWGVDDAVISYPKFESYSVKTSGSQIWYQNMYDPAQVLHVYSNLDNFMVDPIKLTAGGGFIELTMGDVDGNAGDELIKINNVLSGSFDIFHITTYKPSENGGHYLYKSVTYTSSAALDINGAKSLTPKQFILGDFAGIGRLQVLVITLKNPLGTGNATQFTVVDAVNQQVFCHSWPFSYNAGDIVFAMDYDGDGRAELCHIHTTGTDIYAFNGTSSLSLSKIANINELRIGQAVSRNLMIGDINGDGKPDLLLSPLASYSKTSDVFIPVSCMPYCENCGCEAPGATACRLCTHPQQANNWCYVCRDVLSGYGHNAFCYQHGYYVTVQVTDVVDNGNIWDIYYSKGSGGFDRKTQELFRHEANQNGSAKYVLHDINNDGRADLVRFHNNVLRVHLALTTGGFSIVPESASINVSSDAYLIPTIVANRNYFSQLLALNDARIDKITFTRNDGRERMLSGAVNSLGVVTKSEYRWLNDTNYPKIYEEGSGATFPYQDYRDYSGSFWATSETQNWYNNQQKDYNSYFYSKAIIHRQGLGFRGFETFSITDKRGRVVKQTFDPLEYGILTKTETPASRTETTYHVSTASNKKATIRLDQQKETDLLTGNVVTTKYSSYTAFDYPGVIETEYGAGSGINIRKEYTYSNTDSASMYLIGLPTEEKITSTRGGKSWIDKTTITYTTTGLPATKTVFTGTAGTLQTSLETFVYDAEGNLASHTVKPYTSTKTLTTTYLYDANKLRLTKKTDAMGLGTTYGYDSRGRLTSVKDDQLNHTTTYEYDVLDRQIKITSPDGVIAQTAFAWNSSNNGSVISVTSTATKRPTAVKYADAFGRTVRESVLGFNGTYIHTDYQYDEHGRLKQVSDPHTSTASRHTVYDFDTHDRPTKVTLPTGRITTTTYNGNTVTTVDAGTRTLKTFDASGALVQASDSAGIIKYFLRPDGQPDSITAPGNATTKFEYDTYGRQSKITDPSAGAIKYEYNNEGLMSKQTNARDQITQYTYTDWGQPLKTITQEQTIDYKYHATNKRLDSVLIGTRYMLIYGYDNLGRVNKETEKEGTVTLVKDYTYDAGRVVKVRYNSVAADTLTYLYNTHGHLSSMKFGATTIYTVNSRNHFGQLTGYTYGNSAATTRTYTAGGLPATMTSTRSGTNLMNASYSFNDTTGMLASRNDITGGSGVENFTYDHLWRLTQYGNTSKVNNTVQYNNLGNITSKTDAGTLQYTETAFPYRITEQAGYPAAMDTARRTITYSSGSRPLTFSKSGNTATFIYNHAGERTQMTMAGASPYTRTYLGGNYEREVKGSTTTERLYLGGTAYSAPAVAIRTNSGAWALHYIHRDYLGSIVAVSNAAGSSVETRSYDAWGRLRNASTLQPFAHNAQPALLLGRGYTGHEHLPEFGLINMNARLYDPVLGRFLNADPYVQAPDNTQNFNRYSYVLNNPLIYTDPDGEFIHLIVGAIVGGTINLIANWKKIDNFWQGLGYFGIGAAAGALSAGVGAGVNVAMAGGSFSAGFMGTAAGISSTGFIAGAAVGSSTGFAGGFVTGAGNSWLGGNNFGQGLLDGVKNGGAGALTGGITGGVAGGIDAWRKGTNFWTGKASFDLSNAYGASGTIKYQTVTGKYVGKFECTDLYEAPMLPDGSAVALPGRGIILSEGQFTRNGNSWYTRSLLQHEYGHILQAKEVGLKPFYQIIAQESLISASMDGVRGWSHNTFWTETWANYLSHNYFGTGSLLNNARWPAQDISRFNLIRLSLVK